MSASEMSTRAMSLREEEGAGRARVSTGQHAGEDGRHGFDASAAVTRWRREKRHVDVRSQPTVASRGGGRDALIGGHVRVRARVPSSRRRGRGKVGQTTHDASHASQVWPRDISGGR
jgi:hypothetical protein